VLLQEIFLASFQSHTLLGRGQTMTSLFVISTVTCI